MPLVQVYKARRRQKAKRKKLRRPGWQDITPPEKELRNAYDIAARHVDRFSEAFQRVTRELVTDPEVSKNLLRALKTSSTPGEAMNAIPWYNPGDTDSLKLWKRFSEKLRSAMADVVAESGRAEANRVGRQLGIKVPFQLIGEKEKVAKAKKPGLPPEEFATAVADISVPANPWSLKWIEERGGELIQQISNDARKTVQNIIGEAYSAGKRAETTLSEIQDQVGLLDKERLAVRNRRMLLEQQGLPRDKVDAMAKKYEKQLLKKRAQRIARTETISAQAQGRQAAWNQMNEAGALPAVERVWMSPPISEDVNRPCEICLGLDGSTASMGQPYDSPHIGAVQAPPAHPHCRCTEVLRRKEEP